MDPIIVGGIIALVVVFLIIWAKQNADDEDANKLTPARRRTAKSWLFHKQEEKCNYCGRKLSEEYFELDHIEPIARGGEDRLDNLQLLCSPCNKRKATMTDEEFRDRYSKLDLPEVGEGPPRKVISQRAFSAIQSLERGRR